MATITAQILSAHTPAMERTLSARKSAIDAALPQGGTRVGNGKALLTGIDGRTLGARRYKEVLGQLLRQLVLANGGMPPSPMQMILVRRAATLAVWCEGTEADMARGAAIEINEYNTSTNTLRRTLADVGLVFQ